MALKTSNTLYLNQQKPLHTDVKQSSALPTTMASYAILHCASVSNVRKIQCFKEQTPKYLPSTFKLKLLLLLFVYLLLLSYSFYFSILIFLLLLLTVGLIDLLQSAGVQVKALHGVDGVLTNPAVWELVTRQDDQGL